MVLSPVPFDCWLGIGPCSSLLEVGQKKRSPDRAKKEKTKYSLLLIIRHVFLANTKMRTWVSDSHLRGYFFLDWLTRRSTSLAQAFEFFEFTRESFSLLSAVTRAAATPMATTGLSSAWRCEAKREARDLFRATCILIGDPLWGSLFRLLLIRGDDFLANVLRT
jgi:hypothetical protein